MGDDKVKGLSEARREREKQSEVVRLVGLDVDGSVPNALSAVECDPGLQIFLPS